MSLDFDEWYAGMEFKWGGSRIPLDWVRQAWTACRQYADADHEAELAALRAELAVLRNNQLGPVPEGPLKALGAWVADHTDDDTWPNAERYLNAALAEMEALRAEPQKVRSAAISGMDAATQHGRGLVQQAAKLRAESNPDALESERAANAMLTEQLQKAEAERDAAKALLQSGADVVTRGAQIMTLEQLSTWEGCRGFVEAVFEMCERAALGERMEGGE